MPVSAKIDAAFSDLLFAGLEKIDQGLAIFDESGFFIWGNAYFSALLNVPADNSLSIDSLSHDQHTLKNSLKLNQLHRDDQRVHVKHLLIDGATAELTFTRQDSLGWVATCSKSYCLGPIHREGVDLIINHSPIPIFVIDEEHRITHWNKALEKLSGLNSEQMLGTRRQWESFYAEQRPVLADLVIAGASESDITSYYGSKNYASSHIAAGAFEAEDFFPDLGKDGRWLFFTAAPLLNTQGKIIGAVETLQDITKRKVAEQALAKHHDQLEELVQQRTDELSSANEELSQYAYVVSHDLKAPLRAIRNYADFLCEDLDAELEDEQKQYLQGIHRALYQGDSLIDDLLEFSRVGRAEQHRQELQPADFISAIVDTLRIDPQQISMTENWPALVIDPLMFKQVLQNLLTNAFKFNDSAKPHVEIGWQPLGSDNIELYVRDNGIGIDSKYHQKIFLMFQRLHANTEYQGTGIGLAIIKKAVGLLHGSIRVESEVDVGSTFYITLPRDERCE
ncbi:MAG: ATP-binding protein [Motiliproteus sp.]